MVLIESGTRYRSCLSGGVPSKKTFIVAMEAGAMTYEAGAAAVACVRLDVSVVVLGADLRWGEMAKRAGDEERCCTWAGLVLEREHIAPFEGRKGIILVAMRKDECLLAIG